MLTLPQSLFECCSAITTRLQLYCRSVDRSHRFINDESGLLDPEQLDLPALAMLLLCLMAQRQKSTAMYADARFVREMKRAPREIEVVGEVDVRSVGYACKGEAVDGQGEAVNVKEALERPLSDPDGYQLADTLLLVDNPMLPPDCATAAYDRVCAMLYASNARRKNSASGHNRPSPRYGGALSASRSKACAQFSVVTI